MPASRPSAVVRRLLDAPLDGFEKLEIVLALHRAPASTSSTPELIRQLQLGRDEVERAVDELRRASTVEVAGGLVRLTVSAEEGAAIAELAQLYDDDRLLVVRTMSEIAMDRIRGMAARTFADAFTIKRKKGDGDG